MTAAAKVRRLTPLDAARGLAMFAVCVSHFGIGIGHKEPALAANLWLLGMIASPTFIFLSGAILGYLTRLNRDDPGPLRIQLADRGLFLLTITHLVIDGAHYPRFHSWSDAEHALFMTDTIGASLLLGLAVLPRTTARVRLQLSGALYLAGWALVLLWHPEQRAAQLFKEVFFGSTNQYTDVAQNFPLIPWFSVYLAATVLGERVAEASDGGGLERIGWRLLSTGPRWIVAALAVKGVYLICRPTMWSSYEAMPPVWRDLYDLTTPFDKYPPGPTYLLAYGGLALVLVGVVIVLSERRLVSRLIEAAAVVGRASLFIFVLQFYLYYLLVPVLPVPHRWLMIPYFVASIGVLWCAAWGWNSIRGNRFFTLGLTAAVSRRRRVPAPAGLRV